MRILETLGCRITPFDTTPWIIGGNRWHRHLAHRATYGPPITGLNEALLTFAQTLSGITHVWIDKGRWIYPYTLAELKSRNGAASIHYTPDPQLLLHRSRYFNRCIPLYDLLVTTKPFEVELYKQAGARDVMLVLQGYDNRFAPTEPRRELESDVCFIGHCERHYARILRASRSVSQRLRIWGPKWRQYSWFHPWARNCVAGNGIWGARYPLALASSQIALGLLSKQIPETTTTRTFEIPATGVFLLAERTEDHLKLFQESIEAEFFSNDDELKEKLIFYLNHDDLRQKIAVAGYERCRRSGYASRNQLEKVLASIDC
jgi:spore maturation protein CgeB